MLELTCCAEEGIQSAQTQKEARYYDLMQEVVEQKWTVKLLTLEVGARGLVGSRTFRAFHTLGFSCRQAKSLCKSLSEIVARCSYAIYLAHSSTMWPHSNDLVVGKKSFAIPAKDVDMRSAEVKKDAVAISNIQKLRQENIKFLYHSTDEANIESIRKHGLMSATNLIHNKITSKMNSDATSRSMDAFATCTFIFLL